jgi:hypothetical protein
MADHEIFAHLLNKAPNRRNFVRKLGVASAALGTMAATHSANAQSGLTDVDILNFALNLEYLDAEFYNIAYSGLSLDQLGVNISGTGKVGSSIGAHQLSFPDSRTQRLAEELAADELAQVQFIRSTIQNLGGQPIARPALDYTALGFGFGGITDFLRLAHIFEDTAITAYCGSAASIQDKSVLTASSRILAIEAEHVGALRLALAELGQSTPPLDGADIPLPPSGRIFSANDRGLAEIRTPQQVLYAAFGGKANATSGGFFPQGVNGNINTSSATPAPYDGDVLTASPNPVTAISGSSYGQTTISWNAPTAQFIEIRINAPDGPLFTYDRASGSAQTGPWVSDGLTFYLIDATHGDPPSPATTLTSLTVRVQGAS